MSSNDDEQWLRELGAAKADVGKDEARKRQHAKEELGMLLHLVDHREDAAPALAALPPLDVGLHFDVPADRYHNDPCPTPSLSASVAKLVLSSALKGWQAHPRLGGGLEEDEDEPDAPRARGSIVDQLIFGGGPEIVECDFKDWRKKVAKEAREEAYARGALPVLAHKLAKYREAAEAIKATLTAKLARNGYENVFEMGRSQVTMIWKSPAGGYRRGRTDYLLLLPDWEAPTSYLILDLKNSYDASPAGAERSMNNFDAQIQRASYVDGIETLFPQLTGRGEMWFMFAEHTPPFDGTINRCSGEGRELGEHQWRRAGRTWDECVAKDVWPGYPDTVLDVAPRPYMLQQDEEQQLIAGGLVSGGSPGITF